jgi:hypothetical protein
MKLILGFILAFSFLTSCDREKKTVAYGSNRGKEVTINGKEMYYEEYGDGAPLLLLSGGGLNRSIKDFEKCIPCTNPL